MPLDKTTLGALIKTDLEAAIPGVKDEATLIKVCNAIADAVVTHIKSAAQVTGTVSSGAGAGGAVTGTVS